MEPSSEAHCQLAVFEDASSEVGAAMAGAYAAADSWVEAIGSALTELLAFLERRPRIARFLIVDSLVGSPEIRARREHLLAQLARALEAGRPPPTPGSLPAPFGGEAVVGAVAAILHGRLLEDPAPSLLELHESLLGLIMLPYLDVAPPRGEPARPPRER
jgi:hypothetical protein